MAAKKKKKSNVWFAINPKGLLKNVPKRNKKLAEAAGNIKRKKKKKK